MTNADKIRDMSDEELAQWLCRLMTADCCDATCPARCLCSWGSNGLTQWIAMEAAEDE